MQIADTVIPIGDQAASQGLPFASQLNTPEVGFGNFIGGLLSGIFIVAGLMVLLYLLWGGIEWISSGGDKGKVEKARDRITQSIIGLIVLAATVAIFTIVQSFLGVSILNFGGGSSNTNGLGGKATGNKSTNGTTINNNGTSPIKNSNGTNGLGAPVGANKTP